MSESVITAIVIKTSVLYDFFMLFVILNTANEIIAK